jgi:hypothetical protein
VYREGKNPFVQPFFPLSSHKKNQGPYDFIIIIIIICYYYFQLHQLYISVNRKMERKSKKIDHSMVKEQEEKESNVAKEEGESLSSNTTYRNATDTAKTTTQNARQQRWEIQHHDDDDDGAVAGDRDYAEIEGKNDGENSDQPSRITCSTEAESDFASSHTTAVPAVVLPPTKNYDDYHQVTGGVKFSELNPDDILFGRGAPISRHIGNKRMHRVVSQYQEQYIKTSRNDKAKLVHEVVGIIKEKGAKFLKRLEGSDLWVEVVDQNEIYDKVSHALRGQASHNRQRPTLRVRPRSEISTEQSLSKIDSNQQSSTSAAFQNPGQGYQLQHAQQGDACTRAILGLLRQNPAGSSFSSAIVNQDRPIGISNQSLAVDPLAGQRLLSRQDDGALTSLLASILTENTTQLPHQSSLGLTSSVGSASNQVIGIGLLQQLVHAQQQQQQQQQTLQQVGLNFSSSLLSLPTACVGNESMSQLLHGMLQQIQQSANSSSGMLNPNGLISLSRGADLSQPISNDSLPQEQQQQPQFTHLPSLLKGHLDHSVNERLQQIILLQSLSGGTMPSIQSSTNQVTGNSTTNDILLALLSNPNTPSFSSYSKTRKDPNEE